MRRVKLTKEQKEEILKISYRYTSSELAKMYDCSRSLILKIWMDNDYKKGSNNTYYINKDYFNEINTSNKAYVLGFIASDGTLHKRNGHSGLIQIKLQESDEQILKDILTDMDSTYPVNHVKNGNFKQVTISITSQDLYDKLLNIGIGQNKTWSLKLNDILQYIPNEYRIDFLRGYFDGDGCITRLNKNKISRVSIGFTCPYSFGLELQKHLKESYDINSSVRINTHRDYSNLFCNVTIDDTVNKYKLLKLMYYDDCLCLKRKEDRARAVISAIESNVTNRSENKKAVSNFNQE